MAAGNRAGSFGALGGGLGAGFELRCAESWKNALRRKRVAGFICLVPGMDGQHESMGNTDEL